MLTLRAPWLDAALGIDEGGLAVIARDWPEGHGSLYGRYWVDRSPLLLGLMWIASAGGEAGIRALGLIAGVCLIVLSTMVASHLGGVRAGRWAAAIAGVLSGSGALQYVFTTAETLAVVPATASVLVLLRALDNDERRWLFATAGTLATIALLVKQSFIGPAPPAPLS